MKKREFALEMEKACGRFETEYSIEVQELLVLTGEFVGGGIRYERDVWEHGVGFLASVDLATGAFRKEKGFLGWLGERGQDKFHGRKIKPLKIYHVRCRKKAEAEAEGQESRRNAWMLVEIVGRSGRHPELKRVKEEYKRGAVFQETFCGKFELERKYDCFSGEVDWLGEKCSVSLDCDEQEPEKMEGALSFFKRLYDNQQKWDEEFRAYAAEELADTAVEWQGDSEEGREPVTKESFAKRIRISAIFMKSDGEYKVCFEDDDMFYGHTIEIEGSMEKGMEGADIVG